MKMGFQKEDDSWVFRRNATNRAENEAADPANEEEENADGVQHMDESPVHSSGNEDVAATSQNALVEYEEPVYRGEPLSIFERQVLSWTYSHMTKRHIMKWLKPGFNTWMTKLKEFRSS